MALGRGPKVALFIALSSSIGPAACDDDTGAASGGIGTGGSGGSGGSSGAAGSSGSAVSGDAAGASNVGSGGSGANAGAGSGGTSGSAGGASGGGPIDGAAGGGAAGASDGGQGDAPDGSATAPCDPVRLPRHGVCTTDGWCWKRPQPLGNELSAIWGTGPNDIWAVGGEGWPEGDTYSSPLSTPGGTFLHWNGVEWRGTICPAGADPQSLSGSRSDDIWAAGRDTMWHWDGSAWHRTPTNSSSKIRRVHAVSSTLAFAVGTGGAIIRWDGASWQPLDSGTTDDLINVWAFSEDDLWVTGGATRHWDGVAWSDTSLRCLSLWAADPGALFCGGGPPVGADASSSYWNTFSRWTGSAWMQIGQAHGYCQCRFTTIWGRSATDIMALAFDSAIGFGMTYLSNGDSIGFGGKLPPPNDRDNLPSVRSLWTAPGTDYFGVGDRAMGTGPILRFTGPSAAPWDEEVWEPVGKYGASHEGYYWGGYSSRGEAVLSDANTAWLTTYTVDPGTGHADWRLRRFDGASLEYTEVSESFHALAAAGIDDVWAIGADGKVGHFDGNSWSVSNIGASADLAVVSAKPNDVWAIGTLGEAFHWRGAAWTSHPAIPGSPKPRAVAHAGNAVWVVDEVSALPGSVLHQWDGSAWTTHSTAITSDVFCVSTISETEAWALSPGAVIRWDGASWQIASTPPIVLYHSQSQCRWSGERLWVTGWTGVNHNDDAIGSFDGAAWKVHALPSNGRPLSGVWGDPPKLAMSAANDLWVFGGEGIALRYEPEVW